MPRPRPLQTFDAGRAHDRLVSAGEADERLALAVVVGRPDDENGALAGDAAFAPVLRLETAPEADERVLLPLAADRRLVGVAGKDAELVRKLHQHVHDRAPHLLGRTAADR